MTAAANARLIREAAPGLAPKLAIVLGSGLGGLADAVEGATHIPFADLAEFPRSGVSSHRGELVLGRLEDVPVVVLAGRAHYYEHGNPREMAMPIATLAALGVEALILTNAAGSLRETVGPGSPMLITDHINWAGTNPLIGVPGDARFVSMVDAYDPALRAALKAAARAEGIDLPEGVYCWYSGPSFETPAEIRMLKMLGGDAVGMSTVPEVILARFLGLKVAAISTITNMAAGMSDEKISHEHTKAMAPLGATKLERILREFLRSRH